MKWRIFILVSSFLFLLSFFVFTYFNQDGKLHIVFCNVGQGDGVYVRTPSGTDIVIDAGPDNSILECLSQHMPFWDRTIELVFATHPDADHITGFKYILENYKVLSFNTSKRESNTGTYKRIQELLSDRKILIRFLYAGDKYAISDGVTLTSYWPTSSFIESDTSTSTNRYSLVQMLNFHKFNLLLNGDTEFVILNEIFKEGVVVDIFKLPHHGSKTGIDAQTFMLIKPQLSIISAGLNNRYGHPSFQVLEELLKHKLRYMETSKVGSIEVVVDKSSWSVVTQ